MPLTISSVLGFIPTNLWRSLKKFVTRETLIVFDIPFKLSTKYTPALLVVMMCLSFANQFVRNVEIDCTYGGAATTSSSSRHQGYQGGGGDSDLNDFCWNHHTFLVQKALQPAMRGHVTYPGVSGYDRGKDALVRQRYYKQVWLGLGKMAVLAFLPYFLWRLRGVEKMRSLIEVTETEEGTEDEVRVTYFLETLGFNNGYAICYLGVKLLAAATPFLMWFYLLGFIGPHYKFYGYDVVKHSMDESDPWPDPMDRLFPKMAKCEWSHYGFGGDIEMKSAQCQLPMNNLTQWSFFVFWWWCVGVGLLNIWSSLQLLFLLVCPLYRTLHYRKVATNACREDVEQARTYTIHMGNGKFITRRYKKSDIVKVNLSFGDWIVLSFLKRNLADWQFRGFVRKLVVTENGALQLQPMPSLVAADDDGCGNDKKGGVGCLGMPSYPNVHYAPPPTYSACDTASTLGDEDITPACSTPQHQHSVVDDVDSVGNTSLTLLCSPQSTTINILPPVKVTRTSTPRSTQQSQSSSGGGGSRSQGQQNPGFTQGSSSSKQRR